MAIALTSSAQSTWNTSTSPLTASVTVAVGDLLVVLIANRSNASTWTPSGGGLTYTSRTSINTNASCPSTAVFTAPSASAQTFTLSITRAGNAFAWGFVALRLTGVNTVGAVTSFQDSTVGSEQTSLTTSSANSAIAVMLNDKGTGAAGTWVTATAGTFTAAGTTSAQGNYSGIYLNAGTAAAKTIGLSSPTGSASSISAIELTAAIAAAGPPRPPLIVRQATKRAANY